MNSERLFALRRDEDPTGMSGTGTVAYGAALPDGRAVVQWRGERPSTVGWRRLVDAEYIHSHGGQHPTSIVWLDPDSPDAAEARRVLDGGFEFLGDLALSGERVPAALDRPIRALIRAVRERQPIDFGGTPVPVWLQQLLVEELTHACPQHGS